MGLLAVAAGAFGAHSLNAILEANNQLDIWRTASQYHLVHAVAMLAVALAAPGRVWAWRLWLIGILLFSGSLYTIGITNIRILGAFVTPIGGVFLMAGWAALIPSSKGSESSAAI